MSSFSIMLSPAFFSLPSATLGSEMAEEMMKRWREKRNERERREMRKRWREKRIEREGGR